MSLSTQLSSPTVRCRLEAKHVRMLEDLEEWLSMPITTTGLASALLCNAIETLHQEKCQ